MDDFDAVTVDELLPPSELARHIGGFALGREELETARDPLQDELSAAIDFLAHFENSQRVSIINTLGGDPAPPDLEEASDFLLKLVQHIHEREKVVDALRQGTQNLSLAQGGVSQFLRGRQYNRTKEVRSVGPWEEHMTLQGRTYYYNSATQKTQWNVPPEFSLASIEEDEEPAN